MSPAAQHAHFEGVLAAAPSLPCVIYNSPYYGFETRADLFFRLRDDHPNLVGYKEFGGAASLTYAAEHITSGADDLVLLVGVDTQVVHGIVGCGAHGVITGVGNVLPGPVLELVRLARAAADGDPVAERRARELDAALGALSAFDEGPDLTLYYRHLAVLAGHDEYALDARPDRSPERQPARPRHAAVGALRPLVVAVVRRRSAGAGHRRVRVDAVDAPDDAERVGVAQLGWQQRVGEALERHRS